MSHPDLSRDGHREAGDAREHGGGADDGPDARAREVRRRPEGVPVEFAAAAAQGAADEDRGHEEARRHRDAVRERREREGG